MNRGQLRTVAGLALASTVAIGATVATSGPALAYDSLHNCQSIVNVTGTTVIGGTCTGGLNGPGPLIAPGAYYISETFSFGPQDPPPYFSTITGYQCFAK